MNDKGWRLLLLAAIVAAALACGAPASRQEEIAARVPEAQQGIQCESGKEHWRTQGPPRRGGALARAFSEWAHFDPTKPGNSAVPGSAPQVYNTLVQLRGCFFEDTVMRPSLARSWEVAPDGLSWTLQLRDDVRWHNKSPVNGRAFTAADVAFTIAHQKSDGLLRSYWEHATYEEAGPHTVVLRLKEPDADLLTKMGFHTNVILPKEVKEQYGDFRTVPIGTGAFMVKEARQGVEITLQRNPSYFELGADGRQLPYVDEVRTTAFNDYPAELAAARAGLVDFTSVFGLQKLDADALRQSGSRARVVEQLQFTHAAVWFNLKRKPWDDPRARKAVALAVHRVDLIAVNRGGAAPSGFIPAFLKDYAWSDAKLAQRFAPDPERGKQLLAEAGYGPNSAKFVLKTSSQYAQDAEVVQRHLENLGVHTSVEVEGRAFSTVLQKYDFDLAWGVVGGVYLLGYWAGDFLETGNSRNDLRLSDSRVDQFAAAQRREMDPAKRKQIVDQLQDYLYETMPYVPTISRIYYHVISCRAKNVRVVNPLYGHATVVEAWADPADC